MALTKDLVENPSLWRLSMQICSRSLEVFAHPVTGDASGVGASLPFDAAATSRGAAFEEVVYSNPMLLLPFGKTDIVVDSEEALIVATGTDAEEVAGLLRLPPSCVMHRSEIDARNDVLFSVDSAVANFIGRTFDRAEISHTLGVLARYHSLKGRRSNTSNMIVNLGLRSVDILVFNRFGLVMARHFDRLDNEDAVYYILAIFKEAGLDVETDELILSGDSSRRMELTPSLRRFVNIVLPAIFPSAAYHGDPAALKAPFPLGILPILG